MAEGLRVVGQFVHVLRANGQSIIAPAFSSAVQPLFEAVKDKLVKTDIDQEVKQASIIGMANLLTVCHKSISKALIAEVLNVYNDRLQNDLTRDATLKALTKITLNQNDTQDN